MKKYNEPHIVRVIKRIFNVRWWVDYDRLHRFANYIANTAQKFFVPQPATKGESFEAAVKKLKLTEKDLLNKQRALLRLSLIMCFIALFLFIYTSYLFFYGTIKATIVSFVVMCLALVLAFRYHFWYFQIKERKLGCSLREWCRVGLLGGKHE